MTASRASVLATAEHTSQVAGSDSPRAERLVFQASSSRCESGHGCHFRQGSRSPTSRGTASRAQTVQVQILSRLPVFELEALIAKQSPFKRLRRVQVPTGSPICLLCPKAPKDDSRRLWIGYGPLQFPARNVFCLAGFSDKALQTMRFLEEDEGALVREIESVEL